MITIKDKCFLLSTKNTSYCFHILPSGHAEHLYYGKRIEKEGDWAEVMREKAAYMPGNTVAYSKEYPNLCLENMKLEFSSYGKGDLREPFFELEYADGNTTSDFLYENYSFVSHKEEQNKESQMEQAYSELPSASNENESLEVIYRHKEYGLRLCLQYKVFEECDVITKSCTLWNDSEQAIRIERLLSCQLDLSDDRWSIETFNGAWANEMNRTITRVAAGMHVSESISGVSSNRANPFVILSRDDTCEESGVCIGSNLIYSGNHMESLSVNAYGKSRFLTGMNPKFFRWELLAGESFSSPEAVLSFSESGYSGLSRNMHYFVREHIVSGIWKYKERPVLLNSWEAAYFNFDEGKLLKLARQGKKVGIELFVMDDGWFGKRNDDTSSLGDWKVNKKKLPHGLSGLGDRINKLGLDFGIWVEPEMINEDSDCYRMHPDWAMKAPLGEHSEGRNQMILDLANPKVQEYIIESMREVFTQGNITYVKWDMNRNVSDYYSPYLDQRHQGETSHRYVLGLYRIMKTLTTEFPDILFEGCASGGNRFDLGILHYFPQIWASDNTDAICRLDIQGGYSYGYPPSVVTAHVSACPNHQTLRVTSLDTRFHIAAFGVLGYECNLCEMKKEEMVEIERQIADYKKHRNTLQFGDFHRLESGNVTKWLTVSKDKKDAVGAMIQRMYLPDRVDEIFCTKGLAEDKVYHFYNEKKKHNIRQFGDLVNAVSPIRIKKDSLLHIMLSKVIKMEGEKEDITIRGDVLNHSGIQLRQGFAGTGFNNETRLFQDFQSRMYYLCETYFENSSSVNGSEK